MHRRRLIALLVATATGGWLGPSRAGDPEIAVVVHPDTPVVRLSEDELNAIFTTRRRAWDDGARIVPFNLEAKRPLRVAFDRAVLHMSPDEVSRYWIDRRVRGGDRPPRPVPSRALMAKVVTKLEGAIGYLDAASVPKTVRVVARVRDGKVLAP